MLQKRRPLMVIGWGFAATLLTLYLLVARLGYDTLSLTGERPTHVAPSGEVYDVSFPARGQHYNVRAFLFPGQKGAPALISVHGYRLTRHDYYHVERASKLRALGYTVLSVDLSDNGGDTVQNGRIGMGIAEKNDVLGAFDYLLRTGFSAQQIGIVGESMGAVAALLAAADEPRLRAIWADSGYTRAESIVRDQIRTTPFPSVIIPGGMLWAWLLTGDRLWEAAPIDAGAKLKAANQAVYLIHCEKDTMVPFRHGQEMYDAYRKTGVNVTFWNPGPFEHAGGFVFVQDEYLRRLDAFFGQYLTDTL